MMRAALKLFVSALWRAQNAFPAADSLTRIGIVMVQGAHQWHRLLLIQAVQKRSDLPVAAAHGPKRNAVAGYLLLSAGGRTPRWILAISLNTPHCWHRSIPFQLLHQALRLLFQLGVLGFRCVSRSSIPPFPVVPVGVRLLSDIGAQLAGTSVEGCHLPLHLLARFGITLVWRKTSLGACLTSLKSSHQLANTGAAVSMGLDNVHN
mmetsp:Transcript_22126/g.52581  ORF Transcript_22126/g.52581 Transcript_22126/m.52581 type:complete len:206 (+) Transcript_22126:227-844(+)